MTQPSAQPIVKYFVSRNGAVWNGHSTVDAAVAYMADLAYRDRAQLLQGFDATGKSAVVSAPVIWKIERAEYIANRGWVVNAVSYVSCPSCGGLRKGGESCSCFDNHCQ